MRAWSTDRDAQWWRFVRTRCDGIYEVAILAEDMDEEDALELEGELIALHGKHLTNWANAGRRFDYAALDRFHKLRDATTSFISATRPLEASDPETAVARYRQAIEQMHEYCGITWETGLVAELQNEMGGPNYGDITPVDRLTLVLRKLGRFGEIIEAVDDYFVRYPDTVTPNHAVFKRRAEAVAILAGERRAPGTSKPKPEVLKTGTVPEEALVTILLKARRDRYPFDWLVAARLCRTHHDYEREVALLEEYLSGERVPGRSWLELEERLFKLRAMLAE
ncbi:hypothetical protein DAH66_15415 [Sphingomonas koreensis]|uniref:Uncharacterized protein n=2 Tax=Sphingomonas koreensis TaxID=93064 RepID=A0A430G1F9_9SPHN|nr:hypothetical protein DAH66_15415 [Sphingomonas koreensis]